MDSGRALSVFFHAIRRDPRIGLNHIGLFAILAAHWQDLGCPEFIHAFAHELMPLAKVSSTTYHRCIRDLHDFGYIVYEPTYKRNERSRISLIL
ncbi:hypothetical protein [Mucilaginibacter ginsenosidivorans]|uniref:Helix-turn-helix domain-containing protein n=1 Tax=Mucilaginibacter ginsenosidivorans TaxID=398053 RepID=A0A5B8UTV5_9SPHI|nr:hypothetical protein [Mucilaginibacter ginsenosidivorans]QEC62464.1 hypothetical protein FRZ54_07640 [Mucilaginibacter ginsenosidivorans]